MNRKFFITGTDTDCGKTTVACGLLKGFTQRGFSSLGIKPLASGCEKINAELLNQDALQLKQFSSIQLPYSEINPIAFEPPIAPHIAAKNSNLELSAHLLAERCHKSFNYPADICIVEGAGGWHVPLNHKETMANFVAKLSGVNIVLVIGMRLGCLNHSILTYQAILQAGLACKGWIANCIDENMSSIDENILTLTQFIPAPCVGVIPHNGAAVDFIDFDLLTQATSS